MKTAHLVRVTRTHIFLVLCTRDSCARHIINARALAQGNVGCLSPRAHQKSFVRLMFRRTLLDVPDPFPSFCSTPPPTQFSLLMSMNSCATPQGGLLFGRTEPSHISSPSFLFGALLPLFSRGKARNSRGKSQLAAKAWTNVIAQKCEAVGSQKWATFNEVNVCQECSLKGSRSHVERSVSAHRSGLRSPK